MPEESTPQSETVSTNWDAFTNDHTDKPLVVEKPKEETVVEKPAETIVDEVAKDADKKPEEKVAEVADAEKTKLETEAIANDKKELGLADTATKEEVEAAKALKLETPTIEFKVNEILPEGNLAAEGTWLRVAQDLKIEGVSEDTFDAFKEALTKPLVEEINTLKTGQKLDVFATLKPETATALKLMEMGVKEESLFVPTQQIEEYLKLDDAQIVRADLEALGWKAEMVDAEMELLESKKLISHQAEKIRITLNETKQDILQQRTQLLQQFESQKEEAILKQKEIQNTQFEQTLNTVSKFMDVPINDEIKQAIITKYRNGGYDDDFKTAKSKVDFILNKELAPQLIKSIRNTAFEKGRDTVTKKLLEVPPVTNSNAGQKVDLTNQLNNDNWAAFERDHGKT